MNTFSRFLLLTFSLFVPSVFLFAQQSQYTVGYQVTYNAADQRYTVYVVPEYNVPNAVNTTQNESGATASVTIAVPKDFVVSNILDIKGSWERNPLKLGPGQPNQDYTGYSLDPNTNYYVIGKSANQTIYGTFTSGVTVALFSFAGNGCFGQIRVIEPNELFITAAEARLGLNVANSFYSQSSVINSEGDSDEQFRAVSGPPACCPSVSISSPISTNVGVTQAINSIFATNKILQPNGKAEYQAGNAISLQPGFEVERGAVFKALIQNSCPSL